MGLRHLRRRCERYLRDLDLPEGCDAGVLCARLAERPERNGRPIHLLPMPLSADDPCGLWVATEAADYIVFEANTTVPHQYHIIAHELSHLLLEHDSQQVLTDEAIEKLTPSLDPSTVQRMLGRSRYDAKEEREAEMLGSLLQQRLSRCAPVPTYHVPPEAADVMARLSRSLQ
jgi:hypothetical protein